MHKRTVTFEDYNGVERTEDFYFHFTKADILKMEMEKKGGLAEHIEKIIAAKDSPTLIKLFEKLVLDAYGVKSEDGREFIKNDEVRNSFKQTEAYSIIFTELALDDKKAAEFVNEVIPKDMRKQLAESQHPALK